MNMETAVNKYETKHNVRIDYDKGIFGTPLHKATIILDSIRDDFDLERATLLKEIEYLKKA